MRIGEAADRPGVDPQTLRTREATGELVPVRKTASGHRYHDRATLMGERHEASITIGHARVSSPDRRADLDRRHAALEAYCSAQGWRSEMHSRPGQRAEVRQPGLQRLPEMIVRRQVKRLVPTRKDRLLRFGVEPVFNLCGLQGVEVVVIHRTEPPSFEGEPARDVLEIITVLEDRHMQIVAALNACDQSLDALLDEIQETRDIVSLLNQTVGTLDRSIVRMGKELNNMKQAIQPLLNG